MSEKFKSIDHVLEYLRDHGPVLAGAKALRLYLMEYRKSLKAILYQRAPKAEYKTDKARENYAYSHPDYLQLLLDIQTAVEIEEKERWGMVAAETFTEVWRSKEATNRYIDKGHT